MDKFLKKASEKTLREVWGGGHVETACGQSARFLIGRIPHDVQGKLIRGRVLFPRPKMPDGLFDRCIIILL